MWLELMLGRFCGGLTKGISGNVRIGRMSAETLIESVKTELEMELKQDGWKTVQARLVLEELAREDLRWQQRQIHKEIEEKCLIPALNRAREGYSVRGMFWQQTQNQLVELDVQEKLREIDESIDWLDTRKKIIEEMAEYRSPINIFRF